jgi:hypothetical protein
MSMAGSRTWLGLLGVCIALVLAAAAFASGHGHGNGNGNGHGGGNGNGDGDHPVRTPPKRALVASTTGRSAELRKTIPISRSSGQQPRVVLSLGPDRLPTLKRGDHIQARAEVTITTTCVEHLPRCIGDSYGYDPKLEARIVIGPSRNAVGRRTKPLSRWVRVTCSQHRPDRNHHCPLVIDQAGTTIKRLGRLPCKPKKCHVNVVVNASNPSAGRGQVVVVGADKPNGTVEGGKARLATAVSRAHPGVSSSRHRTTHLRTHSLPPSFDKGNRVVLSQRLSKLKKGDVLLVRSRQRTAIGQQLPYFISSQIIVSTRRGAIAPSAIARRSVSRLGTFSESNGFNCTPGASGFKSPCITRKTGIAAVLRTPRNKAGHRRRLYVNVISRSFPKLAQDRSHFKAARVLAGRLEVQRLRAKPRKEGGGHGGHGGHGGGHIGPPFPIRSAG